MFADAMQQALAESEPTDQADSAEGAQPRPASIRLLPARPLPLVAPPIRADTAKETVPTTNQAVQAPGLVSEADGPEPAAEIRADEAAAQVTTEDATAEITLPEAGMLCPPRIVPMSLPSVGSVQAATSAAEPAATIATETKHPAAADARAIPTDIIEAETQRAASLLQAMPATGRTDPRAVEVVSRESTVPAPTPKTSAVTRPAEPAERAQVTSSNAAPVALTPVANAAPPTPGRALMPSPAIDRRETATADPSIATGTSAAKSAARLKKLEDMAHPRRNLDPPPAQAATLAASPAENARPRTASTAGPPPPRGTAADHAAPELLVTAPAASHGLTPTAAQPGRTAVLSADTSLPGPEHLETRLTNIVAELKRLKPDSMSVLLKPDGQTELHLHLQINDGRVDVEARIQRGDAAALGAQWAQLQHHLSAQGIRLGALQPMPTPPPASPDWTGGFPQQHREQHQWAGAEVSPRELAAAAPAERRAPKSRSSHGPGKRTWESWA